MKIAIDARELAGRSTGVGRYLTEILRAWAQLPAAGAHQIVLCAPEPIALPSAGVLSIDVRTAAGPRNAAKAFRETGRNAVKAFRETGGTLWEQFALPRLASDADVLFAPGYSSPIRIRPPVVVTVHDVSFAAHPEWFSWREGTRRRLLTRLSASRAAKVITVSDFSKREIVRRLGVPASKVEVIYSGVTAWSDGAGAGRREPLLLYVGSLFNRRHIPELIAAFALVARHHADVRLEIVGDNRTRPHIDVDGLIAASGVADRIRARSYVSDADLAALYRQASAFAFFSGYEGFAMTPLDALGAGVPVALLDTEVAREIYGPAAAYVARPEPDLMAAALDRLLHDQAERERLLAAAAGQLERYSWRECAQRTLQVLLAAARR